MLERDIKLLPLQGVTNERALTQGVASLALGYVLLPLQGMHCRLHLSNSSKLDCIRFALSLYKIGFGSAIKIKIFQLFCIAFTLHYLYS